MTTLRILFENSPALFLVTAVLLGLVIGSFLNVVIHRLPLMLDTLWKRQCLDIEGRGHENPPTEETFNLVKPRSRCTHCGHTLSALENIPVISYLWLKGRCSSCGRPISKRYPAVEILTAFLSALIAWRFGFSIAALAALILIWGMIALSYIDYDHQILPDAITLPLVWLGLLLNLFGTFTTLQAAVIGAMAGYLSLWTVYHLFKLATGKEGMGHGDFKLLAALGAWLGWSSLPLIILLASLTGAVTGILSIVALGRERSLPIPFGPFLCIAGGIALLWGDTITRYYLQFMRLSG